MPRQERSSSSQAHTRFSPELFAAVATGASIGLAYLLGASTSDVLLRPAQLVGVASLFSVCVCVFGVAVVWFRRVVVRTTRSQELLQAELERRERFWASAAHDVKSHLAAMALRTELLKRRMGHDARTESLETGLDELRLASKRVAVIITELQDVARLNLGAPLNLELRPTDLVALARGAIQDAEMMTNLDRPFKLSTPAGEVLGSWDAMRIGRVISNLLDNAVKYSPPGSEVEVRIAESWEGGRGWACLTVADHGLGIPAEDLPHIFERFHRASNVRALIPGTGLGLAGAQEIVRQHGGDIVVESQQGSGSSITIRLPLEAPQVSASLAPDLKSA